MAFPASAPLPPAERGGCPPDRRGGTTEVPEDAVQDRRALLRGLLLAIVFFTIVVVVIFCVLRCGQSEPQIGYGLPLELVLAIGFGRDCRVVSDPVVSHLFTGSLAGIGKCYNEWVTVLKSYIRFIYAEIC